MTILHERDTYRAWRIFSIENCEIIERCPLLPDRLRLRDGPKTFGSALLEHVDDSKTTTPWLPADYYRTYDQSGALYLVKVRGTMRGRPLDAWCYRPIFRILGHPL